MTTLLTKGVAKAFDVNIPVIVTAIIAKEAATVSYKAVNTALDRVCPRYSEMNMKSIEASPEKVAIALGVTVAKVLMIFEANKIFIKSILDGLEAAGKPAPKDAGMHWQLVKNHSIGNKSKTKALNPKSPGHKEKARLAKIKKEEAKAAKNAEPVSPRDAILANLNGTLSQVSDMIDACGLAELPEAAKAWEKLHASLADTIKQVPANMETETA